MHANQKFKSSPSLRATFLDHRRQIPQTTDPHVGRDRILPGIDAMPFVDISGLDVVERLPGWYGRYFQSENMTVAHYDFKRGATIHEHFHPQEEIYEVIEGELDMT